MVKCYLSFKDKQKILRVFSYLKAWLLKVHDGVWDLDADGLNGHLHVEGTHQSLAQAQQRV